MTNAPRILIVDDDELIRDLLTDLLLAEGFAVDFAINGADAVARAVADPPDAVLMDLMMPVVSGVQAAALLRDDPRTAKVPILAMSAGQTLKQFGDAINADAFIAKPFDLDLLIDTITEWAGQSHGCGH